MGCTSSSASAFDATYVENLYTSPAYEGERVDATIFVEFNEPNIGEHKIHITSWLPKDEPKAVVIISHGLHEHGTLIDVLIMRS
jgi:hypothetical protein